MSEPRRASDSLCDAPTRIARARSHPLRAQIYRVLKEEAASPKEIADRLMEHLSRVSYHVRVLAAMELIAVVATEQVRGSLKTTYRAIPEYKLDRQDGSRFTGDLAAEIELEHELEGLIDRVKEALRAGTLHERVDHQVTTLELELDEAAWAEAVAAIHDCLLRVSAAEEKAAKRLANANTRRFSATVSVLSYENPGEDRRSSSR